MLNSTTWSPSWGMLGGSGICAWARVYSALISASLHDETSMRSRIVHLPMLLCYCLHECHGPKGP